jgi:hypothetical protein
LGTKRFDGTTGRSCTGTSFAPTGPWRNSVSRSATSSRWSKSDAARVVKVAPLPQYRLHVEFDDGVSGTIDLSDELDGEVFRRLRDESIFRQVTVDEFGAVCWPNGPDLAPDAMHSQLSREPATPARQ